MSRWAIDQMHSEVGFRVKHMKIATVRGRFRDVVGTILVVRLVAVPSVHEENARQPFAGRGEPRLARCAAGRFHHGVVGHGA